MPTDEELMARYQSGDRLAFEAIFHRYAPLLLRLMLHRLDRRDDAHDLVQQTFLQLHRSRADFREDSQLRPWLFTIAINLKRRHLRRLGRRPENAIDPRSLERLTEPGSRDEALEDGRRLRGALANLPPEQREVIVLHWFEGLTFLEVAQFVGASLSAVKVRAHRGYAAIRRGLTRQPRAATAVVVWKGNGDETSR
jgi:RNA polymerase sigma-70 factor (ECF subfamily)